MVKKRQPVKKETVGSGAGISESKPFEGALQDGDAAFTSIFNLVGTGILVIDSETLTILEVNQTAADIIGRTKGKIVGHICHSFICPAEAGKCPIKDLGQSIDNSERKIICADGQRRDILKNVSPFIFKGRKCYLESFIDITERKKAEEALQKSEGRYQRITEGLTDYLYTVRLQDGQVVETSHGQACKEVTGYTKKEFADNPNLWMNMVVEEERGQVLESVQKILAGENIPPIEHRIVRKDGQIRWVRDTPILQFDSQGRLVSYDGVIKDITAHKQAEERLKESEARYRFAMGQLPGTMWTTDRSLVFTLSQGAGLSALGLQPDQVVGMSLFEFFGTNDPDHTAIASHIRAIGGEEVTYEYEHQGAFFQTHLTPLYGTGEQPVGVAGIAFDITERKRADAVLKESQQKFQALVETTNDFIWEMNLNGAYTYCSPQMEKLWGFKPEEMLGKTPFELLPPEEKEQAAKLFTAFLGTASSFTNMEIRSFDSSGQVKFLEISGVPFTDKGGKLCGYRGITRDITERKRAEEALKESEEQHRNMIDFLPISTFEVDTTIKLVSFNQNALKVFGYSEDDFRAGMSALQFFSPEEYQRVGENFGNVIQGTSIPGQEFTFLRKDGSMFNGLIYAALNIQQDKLVGIRGAIVDITERKKAEQALIESEEKYRIVVENAQESILLIADGMLKFANSSASELSGYSAEEFNSKSFIEFIHPDDRQMIAERYLRRLQGKDGPKTNTFRVISKQGDIHWMEVTATVITWEGKPATLYFMTDITDRKRLEEEQQRVDKLESVGMLAGGIAHDFNNILTSILGNISLASMEAAPGSELQNSLEQAEKASLRAKALTVQLLTFSKGGAPVLKLASLTELLKDTAGFALSGSKVKCNFSIPTGLWHAEIDAGQVSQVIHNLVINAQQAMPAGGSIEIGAENIDLSKVQSLGRGLPLEEGHYVRIAITDHGIGIPKDHLEKIFDPFFTTKQKGNGMGLAISFSIARQHGGHISVESELGTGSSFYLYLPASVQISIPKEDKKEAAKPAGKARILVMDDEKGVREIAGRMLKHIGYKDVEFAKDGAEAIKLYKAAMKSGQPFTVAILDLTIAGGMGGEETIRKLLKIDPWVKAIVSSGYIDDPVIAKYKDHGFSGVVAKPYTIAELRKAVQDVIG